MQIMVEGLALAAFGFMHQMTTEPLLKQLLRYVMSDEVAPRRLRCAEPAGVLRAAVAAEIRERQEFAFEAAVRMRDRFLQQEVWTRMGVDPKEVVPLLMQVPDRQVFQTLLFSKIVPNCKKLGLLDAADGWLRQTLHRAGRHRLRGLGRHRRGVRRPPGHRHHRRRRLTPPRPAPSRVTAGDTGPPSGGAGTAAEIA